MNRILSYAISVFLIATAGSIFAAPSELNLAELDVITAAGYDRESSPAPNGGAIVGNGSSAHLISNGEVVISDGAQAEARAMNLVNGSVSTVANGVNVFNGRAEEAGDFDSVAYDIEQLNSVTQDQRRLSSLPGYDRGANSDSSFIESGVSHGENSTSIFDQVVDLEQTTFSDSKMTKGSVTSDGAPTFRLKGDIGEALGLEVEFNYPGGGGGDTIGAVFNGGYDFDISAGDISIETDTVDVNITLPSMGLEIDAMGCFVLNGDCTIDGERTETTNDIVDHSTLYTLDESESSSKEWANSGTETIHAAFELRDAQAEYIVIDESDIDVSASYLVSLSGGAQAGLRAMNVVNAAGSAVANGVNVAMMGGGVIASSSPVYSLTQSNVISHSR
jgi:hypothetical protein